VRNGTANVFMFVDVNRPWRHAKVTDQRTCIDFAECMRDLVDEHYPEAERIRVVLDNLSAHSAAALYQAFEPAEARRILNRLEFHFTPKHASWLNMVEIEIGVMVGQCLDRGIPDKATLLKEIAAGELRRNAERARINWMFTVNRARAKLGRVYPQPADRPSHRVVRQPSLAASTRSAATRAGSPTEIDSQAGWWIVGRSWGWHRRSS
jgi:hypothetical protein